MSKKRAYKKYTAVGIPQNLASHYRTECLRQLGKRRGDRLRVLRELLDYTTEEFAKILCLNAGTLGRFERAETCITVDVANMIYNKLIEHDDIRIIVKPSWLLNGQKGGIQFLNKKELNIEEYLKKMAENDKSLKPDMVDTIQSMSMFLEIYAFKKFNNNALVSYVKDNRMSPIIEKGDYVGGIILPETEYSTLNGDICIVEVKKNIFVIRRVYLLDGRIFLTSEDNSDPQILDTLPLTIARMCWRRSNHQKEELFKEVAESQTLSSDKDSHIIEIL